MNLPTVPVATSRTVVATLATGLGMSKSGLFAHFRSKEQLQLEVLETATVRFQEAVIAPALRAPRGCRG